MSGREEPTQPTLLQIGYQLTGPCIYCGKKAARSRTFYARNQEDGAAQAKAAMSGHCHRKCAADHAADLYSMAGSRVCCDTCAYSKAPGNETATTEETR